MQAGLQLFISSAQTTAPAPVEVNSGVGTGQQQPHTMAQVIIDITNNSGANTLTVNIEGFDPASQKWYVLLASAALSALATTILRIIPCGQITANLNANDMLPARWRVRPVHGNSGSITYSIGANLS